MSLPSLCLDPDAVLKDNSSLIKWRNGIPNYSKALIINRVQSKILFKISFKIEKKVCFFFFLINLF